MNIFSLSLFSSYIGQPCFPWRCLQCFDPWCTVHRRPLDGWYWCDHGPPGRPGHRWPDLCQGDTFHRWLAAVCACRAVTLSCASRPVGHAPGWNYWWRVLALVLAPARSTHRSGPSSGLIRADLESRSSLYKKYHISTLHASSNQLYITSHFQWINERLVHLQLVSIDITAIQFVRLY